MSIPKEFWRLIIPVPNNDIAALEEAFDRHAHETALVIHEPAN